VISGPSGAGKGTVVKEVLSRHPGVLLSISTTTRPARRGERNGVEYDFVPVQTFLGMRDRGEFLESAEVHGNLYGTPRAPVEAALATGRDVICELDIQGALAVKRGKPDAILIFIEPPSFEELGRRLKHRGTEDPAQVFKRLEAAYEEVKEKAAYDHVIVNDDVGAAADALVRILERSQ